jgi:CHAT domain-containing protein
MRTGSIFHFAGHGSTDRLDPLPSALLLADGHMTVETVFQQNLVHMPFLEYLSACGTGQVKQDDLMDEGIHLVAAYQLAGFRHVIGTLWSVDDRLSVEAAVGVYEWMRHHSLDDRSPSEALHHTIRKLRDDAWAEEGGFRESRQAAALGEKPVEDACSDRGLSSYMRNIEACEDPPLYWVPYVHFGV